MRVTAEEARNRLEQLLDLAAGGVEVVLTRKGKAPVRLVRGEEVVSAKPRLSSDERGKVIDEIVKNVDAMAVLPELRTSNHDDLYDEHGLPK